MLKIGKVSFINTIPLFCAPWDNSFGTVTELVPSGLNAAAVRGEFDISMISRWAYSPVAESYDVLGNFCIACDGEVMSLKLFSDVPIGELGGKKVYITPQTGSSSRALRMICLEKYGFDIFENRAQTPADASASLIIGNQALIYGHYPYEYDLGELWRSAYAIPMLCAVFVARRGLPERDRAAFAEYLDASLASFAADRQKWETYACRQFLERCGQPLEPSTAARYFDCLIYKLSSAAFKKSFDFVKKYGA